MREGVGQFKRIPVRDGGGVGRRAPRGARLPSFVHSRSNTSHDDRLGRLRAGVVGCGGVGRSFAESMARLEPAEMRLVDHGVYKAESINTQSIRPEEVGRPKASGTGRVLASIHPGVGVQVFDGPVQNLPADAFESCDFVFLATDNLGAEMEVSRRCVRHGVPLIQGSVYGDMLVAQVRLLQNGPGDGPCLACGFGSAEFEHLGRETRWSCAGAIDGTPDLPSPAMPTMSVAGLCSMAADLAMMVVLRFVLELGEPLEDCLIEYCGYTNEIVTSPLLRNPSCPADHTRWERRSLAGTLGDRTLREIAGAAGLSPDGANGALSFALDGYSFVTEAACACGDRRSVRRFVAGGRSAGRCRRCHESLRVDTFGRYESAPLTIVRPVLDRPLGAIGARGATNAVVRGVGRAVLVRRENDTREPG